MALYRFGAFAKRHADKGISLNGLRWQIYKRDENGLEESGAIVRQGRSIWIDDDKYFDWVRSGSQRDAV